MTARTVAEWLGLLLALVVAAPVLHPAPVVITAEQQCVQQGGTYVALNTDRTLCLPTRTAGQVAAQLLLGR